MRVGKEDYMKDKNGKEISIGDRVFFSYTGLDRADTYGKVIEFGLDDLDRERAHIWVESRTAVPLWKRVGRELEVVS